MLVISALTSVEADSEGREGWYHALVESGKTDGYDWGVNIKGPKHMPLKRVCEVAVRIAPYNPEIGYVESDETSLCGDLLRPSDSVSIAMPLGNSETGMTTLLATVYRPIVREVAFVLSTGERQVYRPSPVNVPRRAARGIPMFRYLVALLDGESCIRRVTTLDGKGSVIDDEKRFACAIGA